MSTTYEFDGYRKDVLELWADAALRQDSDEEFNFTSNQELNEELRDQLETFLDDPREETFHDMWGLLHSATMKGNATNVLKRWQGDMEELASLFQEIKEASEYDSGWEERYPAKKTLWEFYGRVHLDNSPIMNTADIKGLEFFSPELSARGYQEYKQEFERFKTAYESLVGHITDGTEHEVPLNLEIDQLLNVIHKVDFESLAGTSNPECRELYLAIVGWKLDVDELETDSDEVSSLVSEYVAAIEDGSYEPAFWKWEYQDHIQNTVLDKFNLTQLEANEISTVLDELSIGLSELSARANSDSRSVLDSLIGREGDSPPLWSDFQTAAKDDSEWAARAFSVLFAEDQHLTRRLVSFRQICIEKSSRFDTDQLLTLATALLSAVHPEQYVCYDRELFEQLFRRIGGPILTDGFSAYEYWTINAFSRQVLGQVDEQVDDESLMYIHDIAEFASDYTPQNPDYYWVNQNNRAEIEGEYLDASVDEVWHHDLTVLDVGDVVFHYFNGQIIGESTVVDEARSIETDDGARYRVDVDFTRYDSPIEFEAVRDQLNREEIRNKKYYPLDKNGNVQQSYLSRLTEAAAEYLRGDVVQNYFWVNSEATEWHDPGSRQFYAATGSDGRKRQNYQAFEQASAGDKALIYRISPVKQVVGEATVVAGLEETTEETHSKDGVTFEWEQSVEGPHWEDIKRDEELRGTKLVETNNSFYITELSASEYDRILHLDPPTLYREFTDELSIDDEEITVEQGKLYFKDDEWDRIQARVRQALAAGNHVLLFGPPGTGKTKLARNVCEETVGGDGFELVTASADWSTFDTVGGYQTTAENELAFQPGVVLDRFQRDAEGTPANEWLIIDELNRADIDKAFGSLFSALTGESVTLPFDGSDGDPIEILDADRTDETVTPDKFFIPEGWRMLATMNTLDKTSLYEMSYAFMRRWAFIPVGIPEFPTEGDDDGEALAALVKNYVAAWNHDGETPEDDEMYEKIGRIWRAVNEVRSIGPAIVEDLYEHVVAGPDEEPDYVSPLIMYVFPQLEGLRRDELERVLTDLDEIVADTDELWTVARDFFQVDVRRGGG